MNTYYQLLKNGDVYKFSNKRRRKCTEKDVQKAVQNGGGMMYFPKAGSTLIWPGMWSPSDIGNPDCGVPKYEVIEDDKPVTKLQRTSVRPNEQSERGQRTSVRRPTIIAKINEPKGEVPAFMKFFTEKAGPLPEIEGPFKPGEELAKKPEPEPESKPKRILFGSLRAVTASLIENVPEFGQKLFGLRQNFVNARKQTIDWVFDLRKGSFQSKDRFSAKMNLNQYMILSQLPIEGLKNFRKMGVLSDRRDTFYQSVLACTQDEYLKSDPDSQIKMVQSFQKALIQLFETSIEFQGRYGKAFMWAVQTLERQRQGTLYSTYDGLQSQITDQLQDTDFVYGFLTVVLGVNIIILHYTSDKDGKIECQIRNNDPTKPFIVLINLGFNKYEPVFWDYKGVLYRYLNVNDTGLQTLNKLFQSECSSIAKSKTRVMSLEDNVTFRVWTQ